MPARSFARTAALFFFLVASQTLGACSRVVSVEPLLGNMSSPQHWEGAYLGEMDVEKRGKFPMLLQMTRRGDGAYDFTIHTSGVGKDVFQASAPLDLIGRGEARIVDVGQNLAIAQTRCELAFTADPAKTAEFRTLAEMIAAAKHFGALSTKVPQSPYIGPFVYAPMRGTPARVEAVMGLDDMAAITQAAKGTAVEIDKWEGGVGDGLLLGSNLLFETDDIHLSNHAEQAAATPFFARLTRAVFAKQEVKNAVTWTRVAPDKLAKLRFDNRFPAQNRVVGWCNLTAAVPKDN